ncbi:MAG TPA: nucleotide sugar dehydrogenase [Polyangia bacterium]|jgi:UDP-N-acetyl-D-glucosamine dehydrogenase
MNLVDRIRARQARVVVVGAGYVGLPLSVEIARAGFATVAYDTSREKVDALRHGASYIKDVPSDAVAALVGAGTLTASVDPDVLGDGDVIIICVPTPLNKTKDPDNSFILEAADMLAPRMRPQQLVVLESTTFPGFTREVLLPRLSERGLRADEDFFLAFSPERVDPGNREFLTGNTPKVLGGISPASLAVAQAMYGTFIERLVPVTSTDAAEMVKLLENTFRAVNIGLVNEVAIMCGRLGLDTSEVIAAAATKPFGFMPFYPGPGLGGHCLPVDPHYLSWKLRTLTYTARFIALADDINSTMPEVVVTMVTGALNDRRKTVRGSRVLVCGVTYKRDVDDLRESPALDIIQLLQRAGAEVAYHDPHVATLRLGGQALSHASLDDVERYDCVVIATDHSAVDYPTLVARAQLIVDTRNATRGLRGDFGKKIVAL